MSLRSLSLKVLLGTCLMLAFAQPASAVLDNTTCEVLNASDDASTFGSFRRDIQDGFNRTEFRMCTDLIKFQPGEPIHIKFQSAIHIKNDGDLDCQAEGYSPCKDGVALMIDGATNGQGVIFDFSELADDTCALEVTASRVHIKGLKVISKQANLVTGNKASEPGVICDNGNHNEFDVEHETVGGGSGVCGNNQVEGTEECDDGNTADGDGCSKACTKTDKDNDGKDDSTDNCPEEHNPDQADCDEDNTGNVCDNDWDNDTIADGIDNCKPDHSICDKTELAKSANPDQGNIDKAQEEANSEPLLGDVCDPDKDGDGKPNEGDNCPNVANPEQEDEDGDGIGAACDPNDTPVDPDTDGDGTNDSSDNCPTDANADQLDTDSDGHGDICDVDDDGDGAEDDDEVAGGTDPLDPDSDDDGVIDGLDECPKKPNPCDGQPPVNDDVDGDGKKNSEDNCPNHSNAGQEDGDTDGMGDACDPDNPEADTDSDGVLNKDDNCDTVPNPGQDNKDGDDMGDDCDSNPDTSDNAPTGKGGCSLNVTGAGSGFGALLAMAFALSCLFGRRAGSRRS